MAPESLYYVSGYSCEWYQAQSPKQWPATSGIAVHVDHDDFIMFDTPSEQVMCRFVTCADDIRTFPIDNRRDGIGFIMDELKAAGWLGGTVGMELYSYRPNPAISARFRAAFEAGRLQRDRRQRYPARGRAGSNRPRKSPISNTPRASPTSASKRQKTRFDPASPNSMSTGKSFMPWRKAGGENPVDHAAGTVRTQGEHRSFARKSQGDHGR